MWGIATTQQRRNGPFDIFPNTAAVLWLLGSVLVEERDRWQVSRRYFSTELLAKLVTATNAATADS